MPELPDVTVYQERLVAHFGGHHLHEVRLFSPFALRSVDPPLHALHGLALAAVERLGKRLVLGFGPAGDRLLLVLHLMIAGRLRRRARGAAPPGKAGVAAFDFDHATLLLTEASSRKRASLHVVRGGDDLAGFDRGGLDVGAASTAQFAATLRQRNHTLKRALTDPTLLDGIGNAYSDEILHAAGLSPVALTQRLTDADLARLHAAAVDTLRVWTERLRAEVGDGFPDKVTAFRPGMAVHGRHGQPCPACRTPVQRIRYADNECNYCPGCQTGGRLLADRGLSQLMKKDWPRTLAELEERKEQLRRRR